MINSVKVNECEEKVGKCNNLCLGSVGEMAF